MLPVAHDEVIRKALEDMLMHLDKFVVAIACFRQQ
jgi:hypothetical protein